MPVHRPVARAIRGLVLTLSVAVSITSNAPAQQNPKAEIVPQTPHTEGANLVQFSKDGSMLLSIGFDGTAKLWSTSSGLLIRNFPGEQGSVQSVALSPD